MTTLIAILAVLAAITPLAYVAIAATKKAGEAKARADVGDVNLYALAARYSQLTKDLADKEQRLNELGEWATQTAASHPVDGEFLGMLARLGISKAKRADGNGNATVLHEPNPKGNDPDGLLDPSSE